MATLPPDPYAPDPVHHPDGTVTLPDAQPEALPGPDNSQPPKLDPDDVDRIPVNQPPGEAAS